MAKKSKASEPDLPYRIDYRSVKHARLEFKTGSLLLVLPQKYEDRASVIEKHRDWISKKELIIRRALEEAKERDLILTRGKEQFRIQVRSIIERYNEEFNFTINRIYFRRMRTKWGSYSPKRNLTINTLLKHLPDKLIEYVIFHEMVHSQERKHNEKFWRMISKKFNDPGKQENDLLIYWFLIQDMIDK